jgi:ABC-type multidrug transport system ATPase subunit
MSEEILRALMELFALVVKQDGGILAKEHWYISDFLKKQLTRDSVKEYLNLFDSMAGPYKTSDEDQVSEPSVKDSVKIFAICKKINRTLNQEQKVVVLMRLFELANSDNRFTLQRINIINTVAEVFNILPEEAAGMEQFIRNDDPDRLKNANILILNAGDNESPLQEKMHSGYENTTIFILRVASVDLYFLKYISEEQLYLNGLTVKKGSICTFPMGSSIKALHGHALYYSDIAGCFHSHSAIQRISFNVEGLTLNFRGGHKAVNNVSFSTEQGKLVGILGASGSGKTTLLNLMSGIQKPDSGTIKVNGIDVVPDCKELEGVFGFVPQDDLLIEDLTVFENLYFAACQCFRGKSKKEISDIVDQTLSNLGLHEKKSLKVGSPFNKILSGGQRKKLNIALELIREPPIMFIDEPTSGLSSRDSENLMSLLRDLTLKGKLIFTVIHQPSSEIFKMFDKVIILDNGGHMAYSGNPVDAVMYFKTLDAQINSTVGECPSCGNVNPETIFNIIETQVVDEFGRYTDNRKVKPEEWAASFYARHPFIPAEDIREKPPENIQVPGVFEQFMIYLRRDLKGKFANRQYILMTVLEAPVLAFILTAIIRYIPDPGSDVYIFADNENIPIYIFMSLIVALFLGLIISAEEIFRDRKILRRERFLSLSRSGYLFSKVAILIMISAFQTFLFVLTGNHILGIKGMFMSYWLALFTTAFCANMTGLNISASFNSAITIYIVIPLLIIPMMVLSGAMFPFDKLNRKIGNVETVPAIAEIIPTRWTYEALMVAQFMNNRYSKMICGPDGESFYSLQKVISEASFNRVYRIPAIREAIGITISEYGSGKSETERKYSRLQLIKNEMLRLSSVNGLPEFKLLQKLEDGDFNPDIADSANIWLERTDKIFGKISNSANEKIDRFYNLHRPELRKLENDYYNYSVKEIVTRPYERKKALIYNNELIQNTDPVYLDPERRGFLNFRAHFFSPSKYIFGIKTDTFYFNIILVLIGSSLLYLTLYFDLPGKIVRSFERV